MYEVSHRKYGTTNATRQGVQGKGLLHKKKSNQHHMIGKAPVILENQPAHLPAS